MKNRVELYREAISRITSSTAEKESLIYHHVYSLKMSDEYLFSSREDFFELVDFIDSHF